MHLKRYWFEFEVDLQDWQSRSSDLRAGCGVTGWDRDDCLAMIRDGMLQGADLPPIKREIKNVDISMIDQEHVIPNMESIFPRGIWFPRGYKLVR